MFEARIEQGATLKKIVDAIKDLTTEINFDCAPTGITVQGMDSSHVSLVSLELKPDGFQDYRCDRNISLGVNTTQFAKVLKIASNDDAITMKAADDADTLGLIYESKNSDRISEFDFKLIEFDSEQLGIPDTEYKCTVKMPSGEFQRIIRDVSSLGDACAISVSKEGVRFKVSGDIGTGNLLRKQHTGSDDEDTVVIEMQEGPVELNFALRYLSLFTKATPLSSQVKLSLSTDVPLMVEYPIEGLGHIRFYLAPKISEGEGDE